MPADIDPYDFQLAMRALRQIMHGEPRPQDVARKAVNVIDGIRPVEVTRRPNPNIEYDSLRCRACGTPWIDHTAECCRHSFRPEVPASEADLAIAGQNTPEVCP